MRQCGHAYTRDDIEIGYNMHKHSTFTAGVNSRDEPNIWREREETMIKLTEHFDQILRVFRLHLIKHKFILKFIHHC